MNKENTLLMHKKFDHWNWPHDQGHQYGKCKSYEAAKKLHPGRKRDLGNMTYLYKKKDQVVRKLKTHRGKNSMKFKAHKGFLQEDTIAYLQYPETHKGENINLSQ